MRWFYFVTALLLSGLLIPAYSSEKSTDKQVTSSSSEQWIIVMYDPRSQRRKQRAAGINYSSKGSYDSDPKLERVSRQIAKEYQLNIVTQWPIKSLNVHCLVATFPQNKDAKTLLEKINNDSRVESVQAMNSFELLGKPDPYEDMQPALTQLATKATHKYVTGSGVSIAIIDSAIDTNHPDLNGVVAWQENLVDEKKIPAERHGTGIAGVIAARPNNGIGIAGVAPDVTVYGLRACWQSESDSSKARCNTLTLSRALDRVIDEKPLILNLSLTGPSDPLLQRLLSLIISQNTIVVSAYDEKRKTENRFPQYQDGVFYGQSGNQYLTSQNMDCLPAPGSDILTLQPSRAYDVLTGNSLAAAHLSGAIALLLEANPLLQVNELEKLLQASVVQNNDFASINICNALRQINDQVSC